MIEQIVNKLSETLDDKNIVTIFFVLVSLYITLVLISVLNHNIALAIITFVLIVPVEIFIDYCYKRKEDV